MCLRIYFMLLGSMTPRQKSRNAEKTAAQGERCGETAQFCGRHNVVKRLESWRAYTSLHTAPEEGAEATGFLRTRSRAIRLFVRIPPHPTPLRNNKRRRRTPLLSLSLPSVSENSLTCRNLSGL